jgi:excisionase family DNA binding protein
VKSVRSKGRRGRASSSQRRLQSLSPLVATVSEAAAALGVSEPTIVRMIRRGDLRRLKGVRRLLIPRADLAEVFERREPGAL